MVRPELIADRYRRLTSSSSLIATFEAQEGIPVDGGSQLLRDLSPFTIRLVAPEIVNSIVGTNASQVSVNAFRRTGSTVRKPDQKGARVGAGPSGDLTAQQIVSAGRVTRRATTDVERAVFVDVSTLADIAAQIETMRSVPPLTLLVNPKDMSVSYSSIQNYSDRTRHGKVFQRWGEGQPTISFSGSTGAFCTGVNPGQGVSSDSQSTTVPSGVQSAARRDSAAFQNFVSLYQFYRNNGYIYDTVGGTEAHLMIGAIAIDYDQWTYVGHIESLDYSFAEETPNRMDWSMEFIVESKYDNSNAITTVRPMSSPSANPAYPSRGQSQSDFRGGLSSVVTGEPAIGETPLALLGTFGLR